MHSLQSAHWLLQLLHSCIESSLPARLQLLSSDTTSASQALTVLSLWIRLLGRRDLPAAHLYPALTPPAGVACARTQPGGLLPARVLVGNVAARLPDSAIALEAAAKAELPDAVAALHAASVLNVGQDVPVQSSIRSDVLCVKKPLLLSHWQQCHENHMQILQKLCSSDQKLR